MPPDARFPHPDGLAAAKACATPGICLFCDDPVRSFTDGGPHQLTCGDAACKAAYQRAWHRDAQVRHPERYGSGYVKARRARIAQEAAHAAG